MQTLESCQTLRHAHEKKSACASVRDTDTDACDDGSTAGHVNLLCQPLRIENDLHESDSKPV